MKLQVPFLQFPICFDAEALASEVNALPSSAWRPHPAGIPGNDALTLVATDGDPCSDALFGPMRPTPHLENCPYLMQALESIGATWGRMRLMRLSSHAEVSPHVDIHYYWRERVRVHIPITTTPAVRFRCGEAEVHMGAGECWIFDTWRMHSVINDQGQSRIHLVADTVGGDEFWRLLASSRPHDQMPPGWKPAQVQPRPKAKVSLDFESHNKPLVMSPWELREHVSFLFGEAEPSPPLRDLHQDLLSLTRRWSALWSCFGESEEGWPRYQSVMEETRKALMLHGAGQVRLANKVGFMAAFKNSIGDVALPEFGTLMKGPAPGPVTPNRAT